MWQAAIKATGDGTVRSKVMDIARNLAWPARYTARVLKNAFTERWHDDIDGLEAQAETEAAEWRAAWLAGDVSTANTFVGEVAGLIGSVRPAADILNEIVTGAESLLGRKFV